MVLTKRPDSYYGSRRPTVLFRTACLTRPNKFSDHRPLRFWAEWKTKTRHFVPRWGERSLSLAFAFSDFNISAFSLWLHRADTCARSSRQASARFRPRPMTDSPLSARSTPLRSNFADYISTSLRSDGRKPARQSKKLRARPQDSEGRETSSGQEISNSPRCFARARQRQYGARLRLSPRTKH